MHRGQLCIGVNDNRKIVGIANAKRLMEDIPNKVVMAMGIKVDVNLQASSQHGYINIVVTPSNMPISYKISIITALVLTILRPIENISNSTSNSISNSPSGRPIPEQVMRLLGVLEGETSPRSIGRQGIG